MKTIINLFTIELSPISFHLGVDGKIGRRNARFIIDTGASQTVVGKHLIEKMNLETQLPDIDNITVGIGKDTIVPELAVLKSLKIGELKVEKLHCVVLPIDHINDTYRTQGVKPIDGIIGNDILLALDSKILMKKKQLITNTIANSLDFENYWLNAMLK